MSFISGLYLWLLPLASIPIIIYLYNRRKNKSIYFGSSLFLKKIESTSLKRIKLINIILLILRTLIILLIILMVSRPAYNANFKGLDNESDNLLVIKLDNSFSMHDELESELKDAFKTILQKFSKSTNLRIITDRLLYEGTISDFAFDDIEFIKNFGIYN